MDFLRQGIGLRSYAQKNPKQEYKREAFDMFANMQNNLHYSFISLIFRLNYNATFERKDSSREVNLIHEESNNIDNSKKAKVKSKNNRKKSKKQKRKKKK